MENSRVNSNTDRQEAGRYARLLSENHRRVLSTALRRVELAAWRLEERLRQHAPPALALTRFTTTPDEQQRSELLGLLAQLREKVAQLAAEYGLEAQEDNLVRTIKAEFSLLWSDLEDTRPKKLRNYGEMHPRAHDLLGPQVQELIDLVLAIDHAALA